MIIDRCFFRRAAAAFYLKLKRIYKDDYNWSEYNKIYAKQISEVEKEHTLILPEGKYSIVNEKILLEPSLLPLHPNHKLLYETIYSLKPGSVLEVGCGCCDHLANIKKIMPDTVIYGCDLLEDQLGFISSRHPELKTDTNLFVHDITVSPLKISKVDLVFTQAVIMHIHGEKKWHLNALRNIFHSSKKYVILMENWSSHNFYNDIYRISREPDFPWDKCKIYVNDDGKNILIVISNSSLKCYKELYNNKELLRYL